MNELRSTIVNVFASTLVIVYVPLVAALLDASNEYPILTVSPVFKP